VSLDAPEWLPGGQELAVILEGDNGARGIWRLAVETEEWSPVSKRDLCVWEMAWSPDGLSVIAVASKECGENGWYKAGLWTIDASDGAGEELLGPGGLSYDLLGRVVRRQLACPRWVSSGSAVAVISGCWSDRGIVGGDVYCVGRDGSGVRNLTSGQRLSVSWIDWPDEASEELIAVAWTGLKQAVLKISVAEDSKLEGRVRTLWLGSAALFSRSQPRISYGSGRISAVVEDAHKAPEVCVLDEAPVLGWRQLTVLQPKQTDLLLAPSEIVKWPVSDGLEVDGLLLRPEKQGPHPMVVFPHGGPVFIHQHLYGLRIEGPYALPFQLLPSCGIAVLLPNVRGSLGYGSEFAEGIVHDMGGKDYTDMIAGVDFCVEQGIADPQRLGIVGWSSGGYLAAWATCQTTRFAAAVVGAGLVDLRLAGVATLNPDWCKLVVGGNLFEPEGKAVRRSPITYIDQVRTPTLIIHGAKDRLIPVEQGLLWYQGLRELNQEAELLIYDGPHSVDTVREQRRVTERILSWLTARLVVAQ